MGLRKERRILALPVGRDRLHEEWAGARIGSVELLHRGQQIAFDPRPIRISFVQPLQFVRARVVVAAVATRDDLDLALQRIGVPAILKTTRLGYDGKGQARLNSLAEADAAFAAMQGAPAVLEGYVAFTHEVSVIAARGLDGSVAAYDPGENVHKDGILRTTTLPARLTAGQRSDAVLMAAKVLNALDYVGVLGMELFVTAQGLIANEIAPRVHNSGHWTQNGCAVDQFEQHIRAITGWPLGDGSRHSDVVMENLIGDDVLRVPTIARETNAALHLYGKAEARPGRKMGHVNRVRP